MSKIVTDAELHDAVGKLMGIGGDEYVIDDAGQYASFIKDLAGVICDHCGGRPSERAAQLEDMDGDWSIAIWPNDSLPDDGGIWKNYDEDVSFELDKR